MNIILFLKGLWIGSTMTIPGVSGGTMAIITGIYENLIFSINNIKKQPAKSLGFLLQVAAGGLLGFISFARIITFLLNSPTYGIVVRIIFAIIVICGIPVLVKKSGVKHLCLWDIAGIFLGISIVIILSLIPTGIISGQHGLTFIIMQLICGFICAVALVLPGISVSHMLYILGLYNFVFTNVYTFRWFVLIPLSAGVLSGIFITSKILENLLNKHTRLTYMIIIGFVTGSIISLFQTNIS